MRLETNRNFMMKNIKKVSFLVAISSFLQLPFSVFAMNPPQDQEHSQAHSRHVQGGARHGRGGGFQRKETPQEYEVRHRKMEALRQQRSQEDREFQRQFQVGASAAAPSVSPFVDHKKPGVESHYEKGRNFAKKETPVEYQARHKRMEERRQAPHGRPVPQKMPPSAAAIPEPDSFVDYCQPAIFGSKVGFQERGILIEDKAQQRRVSRKEQEKAQSQKFEGYVDPSLDNTSTLQFPAELQHPLFIPAAAGSRCGPFIHQDLLVKHPRRSQKTPEEPRSDLSEIFSEMFAADPEIQSLFSRIPYPVFSKGEIYFILQGEREEQRQEKLRLLAELERKKPPLVLQTIEGRNREIWGWGLKEGQRALDPREIWKEGLDTLHWQEKKREHGENSTFLHLIGRFDLLGPFSYRDNFRGEYKMGKGLDLYYEGPPPSQRWPELKKSFFAYEPDYVSLGGYDIEHSAPEQHPYERFWPDFSDKEKAERLLQEFERHRVAREGREQYLRDRIKWLELPSDEQQRQKPPRLMWDPPFSAEQWEREYSATGKKYILETQDKMQAYLTNTYPNYMALGQKQRDYIHSKVQGIVDEEVRRYPFLATRGDFLTNHKHKIPLTRAEKQAAEQQRRQEEVAEAAAKRREAKTREYAKSLGMEGASWMPISDLDEEIAQKKSKEYQERLERRARKAKEDWDGTTARNKREYEERQEKNEKRRMAREVWRAAKYSQYEGSEAQARHKSLVEHAAHAKWETGLFPWEL